MGRVNERTGRVNERMGRVNERMGRVNERMGRVVSQAILAGRSLALELTLGWHVALAGRPPPPPWRPVLRAVLRPERSCTRAQ